MNFMLSYVYINCDKIYCWILCSHTLPWMNFISCYWSWECYLYSDMHMYIFIQWYLQLLINNIMGLCNFFRVVAGRATKAVQWPSNMSNEETASQKHFSAISTTARHKRYQDFFEGYPLMLVDYHYFEKKLRNLEKWLCKTSNKISVKDFTTVAWLNLENNVRQSHSARDCHACKLCIFKLKIQKWFTDIDTNRTLYLCRWIIFVGLDI